MGLIFFLTRINNICQKDKTLLEFKTLTGFYRKKVFFFLESLLKSINYDFLIFFYNLTVNPRPPIAPAVLPPPSSK